MNKLTLFITVSALALTGCWPSLDEEETPTHLHTLWDYAYDLDGGAPRALPLIVNDMVITSGDLSVTALNYRTGELIWKTPFEATGQVEGRYFGLHGEVLTGTIHKPIAETHNGLAVIGLNVQTGKMLWEVFFDNKENELARYPGITTTSHGFFLPGFGNWAFMLTPLGERMRIDTDVFIYHSMVKDDILYTAHRYQDTGALSAYRLSDMELVWRYHPGDLAHLTSMIPIVEDGRVYMATGTRTPSQETVEAVFALDAATGQQLWRTDGVRNVDLADHCPEYLYLNNNGGLNKVRKSDGHLVYYKNFNAGTGSGPVAYLDGYAYVMTPGSMHIVRTSDGEIMARLSPPKGSFFWRVTAHDGRIFAQSSRHLYAFAPWGHTEPLSTSRRRWVDS